MTALQVATLAVARGKRKAVQHEAASQRAFFEAASLQPMPAAPDVKPASKVSDYAFAIPNGGVRDKVEAALLKAEGVKAGVWDIMCPLARGAYIGIWIELKHGDNTLSKAQVSWGESMKLAGYKCVTAWDWKEAFDVLMQYLRTPRRVIHPPRISILAALDHVEPDRKAFARPKREYVRSKTLKEAYRSIPCQHCSAEDGTVCCAHSNWSIHGKGGAIKADDSRGAALCATCHVPVLDQGSHLSSEERQQMWWNAHVKSVRELLRRGLWPKHVAVPDIKKYPF